MSNANEQYMSFLVYSHRLPELETAVVGTVGKVGEWEWFGGSAIDNSIMVNSETFQSNEQSKRTLVYSQSTYLS